MIFLKLNFLKKYKFFLIFQKILIFKSNLLKHHLYQKIFIIITNAKKNNDHVFTLKNYYLNKFLRLKCFME